MVATVEVGSISLFTTAQSDPYAHLADYDLSATWRNRNEQARYQPAEGINEVKYSVRCKLANPDDNFDQNETQPERRFYIQEDEAPTETNQPSFILQTATDLLTQPFKSLWGWMFGSPKEEN